MIEKNKVLTVKDLYINNTPVALNYNAMYLTIESVGQSSFTVNYYTSANNWAKQIYISKDYGVTWNSIIPATNGTTISVNANQKLLIKGYNSTYATSSLNYVYFTVSSNYKVYGNIMSLIYGDNFVGTTTLTLNDTYNFYKLFNNNTALIDASNLILPATTLTQSCYHSMFAGCNNLITAPKLPAHTLAHNCYMNMFSGCNNLITAPELPATTLTQNCYSNMFYGCGKLITAPELPATTLAEGCYNWMFKGCSSLIIAPELPATTLATYCYTGMFNSCSSLTKAPELPATILTQNCYASMFEDCSSLTKAPELPATTLAPYCYTGMFDSCSSLTKVPELPATTLVDYCYASMFKDCSSLTKAPELSATTLAQGCYMNMFYGCSCLTTAPELPATTLSNSCYTGMFAYCSSLTTAPELPAPVLNERHCYDSIFDNCSSLHYIKCLLKNGLDDQPIFGSLPTSGIFAKHKDTTVSNSYGDSQWIQGNYQGEDGIPNGWSIIDDNDINIESYEDQYLTFEAINNANIYFATVNNNFTKTIQWSIDGLSWLDCTSSVTGELIYSMNAGDKVLIKGLNESYYADDEHCTFFIIDGNCNVYGNIMSLIYGDDFKNKYELTHPYTFTSLFSNNIEAPCYIINAHNLILPATTLAAYCYMNMFANSERLITPPQLPATTLTTECYREMFDGCSSLTIAPELPAMTLADGCYLMMFMLCTSLTTAPELPAMTLADYCYNRMFESCYSLNNAPVLVANELADYCYDRMFCNCISLNYIKILLRNTNNYEGGFINDAFCDWILGTNPGTIECFNSFNNLISSGYINVYGWTTIIITGNNLKPDVYVKRHEFSTSGGGNVVTSVSVNANQILFNKASTALLGTNYLKTLSSPDSLYLYMPSSSSYGQTRPAINLYTNQSSFWLAWLGYQASYSNIPRDTFGHQGFGVQYDIGGTSNGAISTRVLNIWASNTMTIPTGSNTDRKKLVSLYSNGIFNVGSQSYYYDAGSRSNAIEGDLYVSNKLFLHDTIYTGINKTNSKVWRVFNQNSYSTTLQNSLYGYQGFGVQYNGNLDYPTLQLLAWTAVNGTTAADDKVAITIGNQGKVGIGGVQNSNYSLTVHGDSSTGSIVPQTTNTYDLGSSSLRWNKIYGQQIDIDSNTAGAVAHINFNRPSYNYINVPSTGTLAISNGTISGTAVRLAVNGAQVFPGMSTNTVNLGTTEYRWKTIYGNDMHIGPSDSSQCHLQYDSTNKCLNFIFD